MTRIVSAVYKAFRATGAPEELSRAAAAAIPDTQHLATKADVAELRTELKLENAALRTEIAELRTEMKAGDAALKLEIAALRADIKLRMFIFGPIVIGLLLKLVFFP